MGTRVSDIHEEGLAGLALDVIVNESDGVIADRVGVVIGLRLILGVGKGRDHRVVSSQRAGIKEAASPSDRAVVAIETALERPVVFRPLRLRRLGHVPLADGVGCVPGRLEHFGDGDASSVQFTAIAVMPAIGHHPADTRLMRIQPGQQTGSSGAAAGGIVELTEPQAAIGESVELGSTNLSAIGADIREPHVVCHHDDNVWPLGCGGRLHQHDADENQGHTGRAIPKHGHSSLEFTAVSTSRVTVTSSKSVL